MASDKLLNLVKDYRSKILDKRLASRNIEQKLLTPFTIKRSNVAKDKMGSFMLSMFLPYIIIILSVIGALYTAIDLTAGEKERGTLETILASPVPRWQLATGKFLTVLTTSLVSTSLAVASMTVTLAMGIFAAGPLASNLGFHISFTTIFIIILFMVLHGKHLLLKTYSRNTTVGIRVTTGRPMVQKLI